ncbi:MAG: ergothioneine biosynthesis protein EgtC [Acidiferrobacteraceae bacterium]
MCRLASYLGPELALSGFLMEPPHSLIEQSWRPREMTTGRLNADGYGLAWNACDGTPARLTYPMPIWTDINLAALGRSLRSNLWLGIVRSATPGFPAHHANTQPFLHESLLFLHNGHIEHFLSTVRSRIRRTLDEDIESSIEGTTDSEYLFALLRQIMRRDQYTLAEALRELARTIGQYGDGVALLNVIVTDGTALYAMRHATGASAPTLYFTDDDDTFPGGVLICSEPLTPSSGWRPAPEHSLLTLHPGRKPEVIAL